MAPPPFSWSGCYTSRTAIPTLFGQTEDLSSRPTCSISFLNSGDFYTRFHPQSNEKVEALVKFMKKIIRISWTGRSLNHNKFCRALLQYRNTPSRRDGLSPAQKLYGHPIQDIIPDLSLRMAAQSWSSRTASAQYLTLHWNILQPTCISSSRHI